MNKLKENSNFYEAVVGEMTFKGVVNVHTAIFKIDNQQEPTV